MNLLLKIAIGALVTFVVIVGGALLFSARPTPILGIDGASLTHSVDSDISNNACRQRGNGDWTCLVAEGPDTYTYVVEVRWDGCWEARRGQRTADGCIDIWDHLQLENTFD